MAEGARERSVIIVGAGIGGLAAGCYARMNGYRATIYEQHTLPGGVCTAWKRQGYTFDGCMHHLVGCNPRSRTHRMWRELGVMPREVHFPEDLIAVEDPAGRRLTVYTDLDRLREHLHALSPADVAASDAFVAAARRFGRIGLMDLLLARPWEFLTILPHMRLMGRWGKPTLEQYAAGYRDSFLQRAMGMLQYDFAGIPALIALLFLGGCATRDFGWPAGGSLAFAGTMAERFTALGGEIRYRSRVEEILVEDGGSAAARAAGVRLADGTIARAGTVISNADGRTTIYDMLGGHYTSERIDGYYAGPPAQQDMALHISLGVARDLSTEPHFLVLCLPEPVEIAGVMRDRLDIENFAFAPETAPAGKTALQVVMATSYGYWKDLSRDEYRAAKAAAAETVIASLDRRWPGLRAQVEVTDVATPLTTERYVGSMHGYQAWPVPNQQMLDALMGKGLSKTLPGLAGFYMVGQWAGGLGLPNVAVMGRRVVAGMCKADGRRFRTAEA
jgi:phytoene dehydrogenase-like protein